MSSELQGNTVNHLLINVSKEVASNYPQLVEWLRKNYHRNKDNWNRLSDEAKVKLREWIGAVITLILKSSRINVTKLSVKKTKDQLKARQGFWADYSDSLQQLVLVT